MTAIGDELSARRQNVMRFGYAFMGVGLAHDAARQHIRTLFRRLSPLFPIARPLGLAARMTAEQHAEVNIEINELMGTLALVLDRVTAPVRWPRAATWAPTRS